MTGGELPRGLPENARLGGRAASADPEPGKMIYLTGAARHGGPDEMSSGVRPCRSLGGPQSVHTAQGAIRHLAAWGEPPLIPPRLVILFGQRCSEVPPSTARLCTHPASWEGEGTGPGVARGRDAAPLCGWRMGAWASYSLWTHQAGVLASPGSRPAPAHRPTPKGERERERERGRVGLESQDSTS